MKIIRYMKDGGDESKVSGLYFVEIKSLFSIVLLHFSPGSREAYHSHAFNAVSWVLKGRLVEFIIKPSDGYPNTNVYDPSLRPIKTLRSTFHKVMSIGDTWALSFRGPWAKTWQEFLPIPDKFLTLTHGRKVVSEGGF